MVRRLIAGAVVSALAVGLAVTSASAAFTNKKACKIVPEKKVEEIFGAAPTQTIQDGQKGKFTT